MRIRSLVASVYLVVMTACSGATVGAGGPPGADGSAGATGSGGAGSGGDKAAGSGGQPASGSGGAVADAGPSEVASGNACAAAGGACVTANNCERPTDATLNVACGSARVCCLPAPDGGDSAGDGGTKPVIGPDGNFACGGKLSCDPKTSYCQGNVGGFGGDQYSCQPLPTKCGGHATCGCVQIPPCPRCQEQSGAVILECPVGGIGGASGPDGGGCGKCQRSLGCCGSTCLDLQKDPLNCGACGNRCPADRFFCDAGACKAAPCGEHGFAPPLCAAATTCCGRECCGSNQICCNVAGPVDTATCVTPTAAMPSCPIGCGALGLCM